MTNRFMMSVAAAALIAGTGFAYAQGTGTSRETPSSGSTVQQNAPSSERPPKTIVRMRSDYTLPGMLGKAMDWLVTRHAVDQEVARQRLRVHEVELQHFIGQAHASFVQRVFDRACGVANEKALRQAV